MDDEGAPLTEDDWECMSCGLRFGSGSDLSRHAKRHAARASTYSSTINETPQSLLGTFSGETTDG